MLRVQMAFLLASIFLVACSKSESSKTSVSPQLQIKALNDQCLDLQSAVQQMDAPGFNFPAFVHTRNFEVVNSAARPPYADSLVARSFRADNTTFHGIADLRGLQQQGCETVTLSDFGGRPVTYNITASSKNHLELELNKEALGAVLDEMSAHHKKQLTKTPMVKKYIITVAGPTEIEMVNLYDAIPSECYKSKTLTLREELVYGWADSAGRVAQSAKVNKAYWQRLTDLAQVASQRPVEIPELPQLPDLSGEQPVPIPVPEEPVPQPIADLGLDSNFEILNLTSSPSTITALQSYAHPRCF